MLYKLLTLMSGLVFEYAVQVCVILSALLGGCVLVYIIRRKSFLKQEQISIMNYNTMTVREMLEFQYISHKYFIYWNSDIYWNSNIKQIDILEFQYHILEFQHIYLKSVLQTFQISCSLQFLLQMLVKE